MAELRASARRVQEALARHGMTCRVVEMPATTRTAKDAAIAIGCEVAQICKSLLFKTKNTHQPILVIASGRNRVNEDSIAALVGEPIEKADAEFVREKTGFAIGGVPPVGHAAPIRTFLDDDLLKLDEIWAAAGTPFAVFCLSPSDLVRITLGEWVSIK